MTIAAVVIGFGVLGLVSLAGFAGTYYGALLAGRRLAPGSYLGAWLCLVAAVAGALTAYRQLRGGPTRRPAALAIATFVANILVRGATVTAGPMPDYVSRRA